MAGALALQPQRQGKGTGLVVRIPAAIVFGNKGLVGGNLKSAVSALSPFMMLGILFLAVKQMLKGAIPPK